MIRLHWLRVLLVLAVPLGLLLLPSHLLAQPTEAPRDLTLNLTSRVKMEFVFIPQGKFLMGSPKNEKGRLDDETQHKVEITHAFYLGKYPVTQEQWGAVMESNPSYFQGSKNPVEQVSWEDCQIFIAKLNKKMGTVATCRLPTEAEWEYACRAGSTTRFSSGDDENDLGNYLWWGESSGKMTHPVGKKQPNPWGLYDVHGNVWQWCQDWYGPYSQAEQIDPQGPAQGFNRVYRGSNWSDRVSRCRSASRSGYGPGERYGGLGFRLVLVPSGKPGK